MTPVFGLIGVPSSAGAHYPGQEKTPAALRNAGLVRRLGHANVSLTDYGDLPSVCCRADRTTNRTQSVAQVRAVASQLADCVEEIVFANEAPLVIGGDCTITIGVVAGLVRRQPDLALLYMDGGLDAGTPATYRLGILDSMGISHLVADPGCETLLSKLGPRYPLMSGRNIVPFGYIPGEPLVLEQEFLARHQMSGFAISAMNGQVKQAATEARSRLENQAERFLVHFDVDVIDFMDFPAADVLQAKQGMTFKEAFAALNIFFASPKFTGLVLTEFNPDHDDPDSTLARTLIEALAGALRAS